LNIKDHMPWWGKIFVKLILSRLPVHYKSWKKISLFKHGAMDQPHYAFDIFKQHYERVRPANGFVGLELGPGDTLFSAIISRAFGSSQIYLIDIDHYASENMYLYKNMVSFIAQKHFLNVDDLLECDSLKEILTHCCAQYFTNGLASLKTIPDESVDFIWSHAVLEHIRRNEFYEMMSEFRRIIRRDGACSHVVDLKDHLGKSLNHLRFGEKIWECNLFTKSGFYTNRLRYSQMLEIFHRAGFDSRVVEIKRWEKIPLDRSQLSEEYRYLSNEELCVAEYAVILKPI